MVEHAQSDNGNSKMGRLFQVSDQDQDQTIFDKHDAIHAPIEQVQTANRIMSNDHILQAQRVWGNQYVVNNQEQFQPQQKPKSNILNLKMAQPDSRANLVQRAFVFDPTAAGDDRLQTDDNRPWRGGIDKAMNLKPNEARCHVISFEAIRLGVWQAIVKFIYNGGSVGTFQKEIGHIMDAIFPNGNTSLNHTLNKKKFQNIAKALHANAMQSIKQIIKNKANDQLVAKYADVLVLALNSSPDNLRPGDAVTNSSIGSALDPRGPDVKITMINGKKAFLISGKTAKQLRALTVHERRNLIEVYVDKKTIQHSERKNLTANKMSGKGYSVHIETASGGYTKLH